MNSWKVLLLSSALVLGPVLSAQELEEESECTRTLRKAQKTYEDGLIEKVENMIKPCLEGGSFSRDEQLQAYRLLVLSKLYDEKQAEAEDIMIKFLTVDPEYEIQPGIDPKEFTELFEDFHTSPLYTIGVFFGTNWTLVNSYLERGAYNTETEKKNFSSDIGIQIGANVSRYIYNGLNAHLDLIYVVQNKYTYTHTILGGLESVTASETQSVLNVPLTFSWTFFRYKSLRPYVRAGFGMRYLLSAQQVDQSKDFPNSDIASVTGPAIDIKSERNTMNFEGVFGLGAKYKVPRGDFFLDARYTLGLNNQRNVNTDTKLNDDARFWNFGITDNDWTMNNMYISVGYNYYLYKPRKKKEKNE